MKFVTMITLAALVMMSSVRADIKVVSAKGNIQVRRGVGEAWQKLAAGDVLKPEDSMKSGKNSSAIILVDGKKKITLPEMAIVDCSDFRNLTQEELLLMLAMESVRSVQVKESDDMLNIPKTTSVHGENRDIVSTRVSGNSEDGLLQLNGTNVLYDQGFYATCVLKVKEVLRIHPRLRTMVSYRLNAASAMEKMKLNGEALSEYNLLKSERLTPEQRSLVDEKISTLKKKR